MRTSRLKKKQPIKEHRSTIKHMHEKKINEFLEYYKTRPKKEKELEKLKRKLNKMDPENWKTKTEYRELQDVIKKLELEIYNMKNETGLSRYLLDSQSIILKMSRLSEESSEIEENDESNFLETNNFMSKMVKLKGKESRGQLMQEYLVKTGQGMPDIKPKEEDFLCTQCKTYMLVNEKESMLSCENCGLCRQFVDTSKVEWSDNIEIVTPYSYKRHNHFEVHLRRVQGKETKSIPSEVIDKLKIELRKEKLTDRPHMITEKKVRQLLKKLGENKYYSNVHSIIYILTGKRPPQMSKELEDKLRIMFNLVQEPFEKFKSKTSGPKPGRNNFFSYKYTINKFLRILGQNDPTALHYLKYFPPLKSREKLIDQDKIWKLVCAELDWEYHPSG